ncbi:uncharacterized protein ARMOST_15938 [Armillaria ostoyae]|uniref:F-box domain-containing protein n=1 Tax=Armillaria ostoyae TaxID=47428 RepID=A0A284RUS4_ARMOS|nr:uncharacterized protein ARMOST_15938 [Armillaria ostoyae]
MFGMEKNVGLQMCNNTTFPECREWATSRANLWEAGYHAPPKRDQDQHLHRTLTTVYISFLEKLVKSMRISKRKLMFTLRLRAFLRRVKCRGKSYPVSLLTLPNELLQEIAYFLCKRDQKALHSTCRRVEAVLSTIVLSAILINITLPFSDLNQDILEYIASQPAGYVHELRICIWGSHAERHAPTDWDVAEGGNPKDKPQSSRSRLETKASSDAIHVVHQQWFSQSPAVLFSGHIHQLPTIDPHLTHPEFTLPYFSHLSQFRNMRKFSLTGYLNNSTPTIEKTLARVLANNQHLSDLFLHLVDRWDRSKTSLVVSGIERVFPTQSTTNISLRHLTLKEGSITAAPHIFHHLRGLQSLQISNIDLYNTSTGFWIELARQGIHIPSITLKSRGVPSAVIDYLVSNEGMAELTFEVEIDRGNVSKRVLSEVVPRHSRTLEVLQLTLCWGSHWAIGRLPDYVVGVSQCSKPHSLGIVVEGNKAFTDPVLSLLKVLLNLQTLRLVAHTNDFTPVVKRIECIRDDEPLLKRLQVVSVLYLGRIKFGAGQSGWDFDDEEPDVLRDDPWYLGA